MGAVLPILSPSFLILSAVLLAYLTTGNSRNILKTASLRLCATSSVSLVDILLHLFNGLFSRTTWVSRHQKRKLFWIFTAARDDGVVVAST